MRRRLTCPSWRPLWGAGGLAFLVAAACGPTAPAPPLDVAGTGLPHGPVIEEQVLLGRQLVISRDCAACHGGSGPSDAAWLAGGSRDQFEEFVLWRPNLTPDERTGTGRYTPRQLFNALRYGLRPSATPDVEIASAIPGVASHPENPRYLSPGMPWASARHMSDRELWAIIAYLQYGVRPVENEVPQSEAPSDHWATWFSVEQIGPLPVLPFPTANEELRGGADLAQVLRGRRLVSSSGCGECHGGRGNPAAAGWLAGLMSRDRRPMPGPFEQPLQVGPFATYPRNLTPDNTTGLGRFSERQIFNALRYGLRPGETADIEITSTVPGEGGFPLHPKYLPPSMPWVAWRHFPEEDLLAIVAYLKNGLKPVHNRVPDSEGPSDFWVSLFTPENFGTHPAPPFPTARERRSW